jgi:hypothetical protein
MAGRKSTTRKKTAKRAVPRKAVAKKAVKAKARTAKTARRTKGEFGEGNYKASRRFRASQERFVKANKKKIPAMGKAAEDALLGPEGAELKGAEAQAASRAADRHPG